jgi:hypothetical protein
MAREVWRFFGSGLTTNAPNMTAARRLDKQIAATALMHDLTVVTRNSSDFASTGGRLLNPFLD